MVHTTYHSMFVINCGTLYRLGLKSGVLCIIIIQFCPDTHALNI